MFEFFGVVGLTQRSDTQPDYSAVLACAPATTDCKHPPAKPYALDRRTRLAGTP